jgi:hypothetical protein
MIFATLSRGDLLLAALAVYVVSLVVSIEVGRARRKGAR